MAIEEHMCILFRGVDEWNQWRKENPTIRPHLVGANLAGLDLSGANLTNAWLSNAWLNETNLKHTDLTCADLREAKLDRANLTNAILRYADLRSANLSFANLSEADLSSANLSFATLNNIILMSADLSNAVLNESNLMNGNLFNAELFRASLINTVVDGADFNQVRLGWTTFGNNDLSKVEGLDNMHHAGPSTIGIDTLYKSGGSISESFLHDCGILDTFVAYIPSLIGDERAIQFYSCFISYSHKNEEFARRLHSRMRDPELRVWFAPEDLRGGEKLYEQIDRAIQMHDRLLLVLSEESLKSEWVRTEICRTRKAEIKEKRRKLFPIRLVEYDVIQEWECFDADTGKDLAVEVREYFIPDFSAWKEHDVFETSFARLLRDLKAEEAVESRAF